MRYRVKRFSAVNKTPIKKRNSLSGIYEIFGIVICILSLALIIFTFFIRPGTIYGHSMQSTLYDGDIVLFSLMVKNVDNGDIIVFEPSGDNFSEPLVKRVIATEGQTVNIDPKTGIISVDGIEIAEDSYVSDQKDTVIQFFSSPYTVEPGHVFVLGDNRGNSIDSRHKDVGTVALDNIIGKVILRIYPFESIGTIN